MAGSREDAGDGVERSDGGLLSGSSRELCAMHAPISGGGVVADMAQKGHAALIDHDGNLVVVGSFSGTMLADDYRIVAGGPIDGFVIKLDRNCHVLWARALSGNPAGQVWLAAVAADDEANLYVGGGFSGKTGIGDATVDGNNGYEGFVMRLAPADGSIAWSKTYSSKAAAVAITDLVVDAQRRLTLLGYAGADTSLGGGPIGFLYAASIPFLAQLKTDGSFGWSRTFTSADLLYGLALGPNDDGLILTGWASKSVDLGAGALSLGHGGRYLAKLNSVGAQQWLRALPHGAEIDQWNWWKGGVTVDTSGGIVVLRDEPETLTGDSGAQLLNDSVEKYDAKGNPVWETRLSDASTFDAAWGSALARLSDDHVLRFGSFVGTTAYAGQKLVSRGYSDVALVELDTDGRAVSVYTMGGELHDRALAAVADDDGSVFTSHVAYRTEAGDDQELVVTALARR